MSQTSAAVTGIAEPFVGALMDDDEVEFQADSTPFQSRSSYPLVNRLP
jgi:hypothetical protein